MAWDCLIVGLLLGFLGYFGYITPFANVTMAAIA
jgi:hypothetical protein